MTSNARRSRRSNTALAAALQAQKDAETKAAIEAKTAEARIKELEAELWRVRETARQDRLMRLSAQRGLVAYMREHGLGDKIGYDPDRDPDVLEAIGAGVLPKAGVALKPLIEKAD